MVSDVSLNTALDHQSKTQAASTQLAEDFSQFLSLLTTQLQHQDPMDPMDTTEFTNQIVAFTGVEQQINTNQKLDSLVSLQLSNALSSSLDYVGMDIRYIGSEFHFDGSTPAEMDYALDKDAAQVKIRIVNEEGEIVYEEDGDRTVGKNQFTWDGKNKDGELMPEGTYRLRVDALDIDGNPVESTGVVGGRVRGIETQNGLIYAIVGDRAVAMSNILNATEPKTSTAEPEPDETEDTAETGTDEGDTTDET